MNSVDLLDLYVGERAREMRLARDLSMQAVACAIDATLGELREFEAGARRMGAGRLFMLAKFFEVSVTEFFVADRRHELGWPCSSHSVH